MICAADSSPAAVAPGFSPACAALKGGATPKLQVALELNGGLPAAGRVEVDQVHARVRHIVPEDLQVVAEIKLVLPIHVGKSITQAGRAAYCSCSPQWRAYRK